MKEPKRHAASAALEVVQNGQFNYPPKEVDKDVKRKKLKMDLAKESFAYLGAGIGAGLAIIGAAGGIGKLAASAMDGIARQPSASGDIRGGMIVAAGLIEGATLFALVICILLALK